MLQIKVPIFFRHTGFFGTQGWTLHYKQRKSALYGDLSLTELANIQRLDCRAYALKSDLDQGYRGFQWTYRTSEPTS